MLFRMKSPSGLQYIIGDNSQPLLCFCYFLKYLSVWLCRILVSTCRIISCGMQTLSWGKQDLVSWLGIGLRLPVLEAQSLSHWTTKEAPPFYLLMGSFSSVHLFFGVKISELQKCYEFWTNWAPKIMGKFSFAAVLCDLSVCVCVCVWIKRGRGRGEKGKDRGRTSYQTRGVDRQAESWGPPVLYDLHGFLKALASREDFID